MIVLPKLRLSEDEDPKFKSPSPSATAKLVVESVSEDDLDRRNITRR